MSDEKQKKIAQKFISTSGPTSSRKLPSLPDENDEERAEVPGKSSRQQIRAKGKSIFAQRMAEKAAAKKAISKNGGSSAVLKEQQLGTADARSNDNRTEEMNELLRRQGVIGDSESASPESILQMREQFLASLSEETRQLLLSRMGTKKGGKDMGTSASSRVPGEGGRGKSLEGQQKQQKVLLPEGDTGKGSGSKEAGDEGDEDREIDYEQLPVKLEEVKKFPHMDTVEPEKLGWTMDTKKKKMNAPEPSEMQARFDMHGNVIDHRTASERTWLQGLHHHGEEMERPGYTFEELLIYARSTVVSQRAFALVAIAAIFNNSHEGVYDSVLNINPLDLLANVDVVCALRKAVDFEDKVTLDASLSCLSAVIFPKTEEDCYDVAYLFPDAKPFLWHKVPAGEQTSSKDPTIRDHQVLTSDLLQFLVERTHLLKRIEYLLAERPDRLSESSVISALQILIRVARHSPDELLRSKRLMSCVCKFLTSNWAAISAAPAQASSTHSGALSYNPVAVQALLTLKLLRLLVLSSVENARIVHHRYCPMETVVAYLATHSQYTAECCCHAKLLLLESFRFWSSSVEIGLATSELSVIFPTLALSLRYFCEPEALKGVASFDGYYLAQVFNYLHCLLRCGDRGLGDIHTREDAWQLVKDLEYFVVTITMQVLQILATTREDWTLVLASKGIEFLTTALRWGKLENRRSAIVEHIKQIDLKRVAMSLQKHSVIINITKIRSRYPSNFISSSAVLTSSSVNPIIAQQSPFQFYKPWIQFLDVLCCEQLIFTLEVRKYLELLSQAHPLEYFETFYIRFEQSLIFELLTHMDIEEVNVCTPVHLICTLSRSDFTLFMGLLKLIAAKTDAKSSTDILRLYLNCYFPSLKIGGLKIDHVDLDNIIEVSMEEDLEEPILFCPLPVALVKSKFWMLEPISRLATRYADHRRDLKQYLSAVVHESKTCLSFVYFLLRESIVFTTFEDDIECYINVAKIFSLGEEVFLDPSVEVILKYILQELFSRCSKVDLPKQPQPFTNFHSESAQLTSFKDYYRDLVKEFESLSYCSDLFSAYLMFPLLPTESREIKLLFWSMQGLQFVRLGINNGLISADHFTREVETDRAMLQLYALLLMKTTSINRTSNELVFHVLDYHVTRGLPFEDMQKVMKVPW